MARDRGCVRKVLATLAHELRNPLAPLSIGISLLGDAPLPALAQKTLGVMRRQLDHMVRLIDDLLDVARIAQGKIELRHEHVALASIIGAAVEANMGHFERAQHELDIRLSAEDLYLEADKSV